MIARTQVNDRDKESLIPYKLRRILLLLLLLLLLTIAGRPRKQRPI
jgi:hypothetical protein